MHTSKSSLGYILRKGIAKSGSGEWKERISQKSIDVPSFTLLKLEDRRAGGTVYFHVIAHWLLYLVVPPLTLSPPPSKRSFARRPELSQVNWELERGSKSPPHDLIA